MGISEAQHNAEALFESQTVVEIREACLTINLPNLPSPILQNFSGEEDTDWSSLAKRNGEKHLLLLTCHAGGNKDQG